MGNLAMLLSILESTGIAIGASSTGDVAMGAKAGAALIDIVQKAMAAHQQIVGQPIDPSLITPYVPLP